MKEDQGLEFLNFVDVFLVIAVMSITDLLPAGLPVETVQHPAQSQAITAETGTSVMVLVRGDAVVIDGIPVAADDYSVRNELSKRRAAGAGRAVVRGEKGIAHDRVLEILGICEAEGFEISLDR